MKRMLGREFISETTSKVRIDFVSFYFLTTKENSTFHSKVRTRLDAELVIDVLVVTVTSLDASDPAATTASVKPTNINISKYFTRYVHKKAKNGFFKPIQYFEPDFRQHRQNKTDRTKNCFG